MHVSKWVKFGKIVTYEEVQLSAAEVYLDEDGKPYSCEITVIKRDDHDEFVGQVIRFNAEEMFKIFMGVDGWQQKEREYANKTIAENRKEAGIE